MSANKEPDKGRAVQAWLSPDLLREVDAAAEALDWSRSQFIVRAIERYLADMPPARRPASPRKPAYQHPAP